MTKSWRKPSFVMRTLLLLVWLLAAPFGCSDPPGLARLSQNAIILAFGDSLTYGTGAKAGQSYPAVLAELTERQVIRAGVPGEETSQGLKRLPAVLDEHLPDLVILGLGGNDILRRRSNAATKQNLAKMVQLIRDRNIQVVIFGVPEFGLFPDTADFYHELADEMALVAENEIVAKLMRDSAMKSDPIHFNQQGYRKLAEALHAMLIEAGAL